MSYDHSCLVDGKYSFRDLVDIERLRMTLDRFSQATGFTTAIFSYPGQELLVSTGWRDICLKFHRARPESEPFCRESNLKLSGDINRQHGEKVHQCRLGLVDGASPIIIEGVHIASLFSGQVMFAEPDRNFFINQAEKYGYDVPSYMEALSGVPVVTEDNFRKMLIFLKDMAVMFAEQGLSNLQKREAAVAARESEEKFRILAETSPMGIMLYRNDRWIYANSAAESISGYSLQELREMMFWEFVAPEYRQLIRDRGRARQKGTQPGTGYEFRIISKSGEERWVLLYGNTVKFEGDHAGLITVLDITERRRGEEELRKLQKLESIGTLAGGIAHDFNNILTGLFGNISIARASIPEYNPALVFLNEAENAINRATRLTGQLLTFAKGGDPVKENVSLGELVKEVARFDLAGSNVKPVFEFSDDLRTARVDKGQIQQVFSNLVINADQSMPAGGCIYITLKNIDLQKNEVPNMEAGKYIMAAVRDEGKGIERKNLDRIFDLYFSTREEGSGLGLATVYSIVTRHGGHIDVDSEPGRGTVFTMYLPASATADVPVTLQESPEELPAGKNLRILILDDEEKIRHVLTQMIRGFGFTSDSAAEGREALRKYIEADKEGRPFDIVIMDLTVPGGMGGRETVRELLEYDPAARVIVSSGYSTDPVIANYREYGFSGRLAKPFQVMDLKKELAGVIGERDEEVSKK